MWIKALGIQSDTCRRVCSLHFPEDAFETRLDTFAPVGYKRRRLRCEATPTDSTTEPADGAHNAEDLQDDPIVCEAEQQRVMFANFNEAIHLAGDGRCDSPGFSAKYMTYSFMEAKSSKVIHFVQVQLG
ncbi:hypothetical protein HPB50_027799 [Hyalomma asiaticum]|nr:hypothetical protein HPB50_027799 [Hyalomma asiaticum]